MYAVIGRVKCGAGLLNSIIAIASHTIADTFKVPGNTFLQKYRKQYIYWLDLILNCVRTLTYAGYWGGQYRDLVYVWKDSGTELTDTQLRVSALEFHSFKLFIYLYKSRFVFIQSIAIAGDTFESEGQVSLTTLVWWGKLIVTAKNSCWTSE